MCAAGSIGRDERVELCGVVDLYVARSWTGAPSLCPQRKQRTLKVGYKLGSLQQCGARCTMCREQGELPCKFDIGDEGKCRSAK